MRQRIRVDAEMTAVFEVEGTLLEADPSTGAGREFEDVTVRYLGPPVESPSGDQLEDAIEALESALDYPVGRA